MKLVFADPKEGGKVEPVLSDNGHDIVRSIEVINEENAKVGVLWLRELIN